MATTTTTIRRPKVGDRFVRFYFPAYAGKRARGTLCEVVVVEEQDDGSYLLDYRRIRRKDGVGLSSIRCTRYHEGTPSLVLRWMTK